MQWYYVENGQRVGPMEDSDLARLVAERRVGPSTLVWNADLPDWQLYGEVAASGDEGSRPPVMHVCQECGVVANAAEMVHFSGAHICTGCKPVFLMRLREGVFVPPAVYGGFWMRAAAKLLDQAILGVAQGVVQVLLVLLVGNDPFVLGFVSMGAGLLHLFFWFAYNTWFVGRYGATPGKMALGLRVLVSDGSDVSYARALGRVFAELLSGWVLYIGYFMAAFDKERRTLHDHICDTRVIKT